MIAKPPPLAKRHVGRVSPQIQIAADPDPVGANSGNNPIRRIGPFKLKR